MSSLGVKHDLPFSFKKPKSCTRYFSLFCISKEQSQQIIIITTSNNVAECYTDSIQ